MWESKVSSAMLTMQDISKRFGATRALDGVSLDVAAGEVMALIGENGAGKSTLMKILSGALRPDAGVMKLGGAPFRPSGPLEARRAGVAMIYQELNLAPHLSVEDNVMLGQEVSRFGILLRKRQRPRVMDALRTLGHSELRPETPVQSLSIGARQLVEIARALVMDARVIVFDEPTSSLPQRDVERLFEVIRRLRDRGIAIVYISHFLEEIRSLCSGYTVLRDGRTVGHGNLAGASEKQIVSLMVGRSVDDLFPRVPHTPGKTVLSIAGLTGRKSPREVTLNLRRGEIFGIAGLVGAGRTELVRCLFGLDAVRSGTVSIVAFRSAKGRPFAERKATMADMQSPRHSPRARIAAGLGMLSEDRKSEGLAQSRSIEDNLTYSRLAPYHWFGWLNLRKRREAAERWMSRVAVKARSADQPVQELSGGNQQKVALARVLHQEADVLLLDEPTRGIDVGTKSEIYRMMGELAAQGRTVVFVSSYLTELMAVCDRIGVMSRGRLREVRDASAWSEESIMSVAVAGESE